MHRARTFVLLVIVACASAPTPLARSSSPASQASAPSSAADLSRERARIGESNAARNAGDYDTARAKVAEAVTSLLARPSAEQDAAWLALLNAAGDAAYDAQDSRTANTAWQRVYDIRLATLPDDHPDLQVSRAYLADTLFNLGDLAGARTLQEKVLEVRTRTLPDDHLELQRSRLSVAMTIQALGDLEGARELEEKVLDVYSRTLPDDHFDLQLARVNLAVTVKELGDVAAARPLEEKVLEVFSATLPDGHPYLQTARSNLAVTLEALGDLAGGRALNEKVLAVGLASLPDEHPALQSARMNLAGTLFRLGDFGGARTLLEKVLEVRSRTLPDDHPALQNARLNLALAIGKFGDFAGERALEEKVLEVRSRTLPEDHADLQVARQNLATTIKVLGDYAAARELEEKVLEVFSRTLPDDHPDLQMARGNLAVTLRLLGDFAAARVLQEKVLEVFVRTMPDDHPYLQTARTITAETIASQFAHAARASGAADANMETKAEARDRCAGLIEALCRAQVRAARDAILGSSGREAEERCVHLARDLDTSISFASGYGVFEPLDMLASESFVLSEMTRGAAIVAAKLTRKAAGSPKYRELRAALGKASDELAALAQSGTTSTEFDHARTKRESVERNLVALARAQSGDDDDGIDLDVESLAGRLDERTALVGFRKYTKTRLDAGDESASPTRSAVGETSIDSLCAFVLRSSKHVADVSSTLPPTLTLVDLGPIEPIEAAVRAWRDGLGVGGKTRGLAARAQAESTQEARAQGSALREKLLDPLLPALVGVQRIVAALDDVLNLVPLDALSFDDGSLAGDRWRIETRTTLTELFPLREPTIESGPLIAFGDVDYAAHENGGASDVAIEVAAADVKPRTAGSEIRSADTESHRDGDTDRLRGSTWSNGFSALPATGVEVRGITQCFRDRFGADASAELCEQSKATRAQLLALAPTARYLHIATHGWFASESIPSWNDAEPVDKVTGLGSRESGEEQVKGMSPMLLCGLAFAGANLPAKATGRAPGLVTADELATLDLSNCELVVLSACDTNVGERRAGQGVASLQRALQMAGARSVITSLWKVPDEATKELMLDFYRRMWVEKKPKHQALWEAKTKLREARDERGEPKYTTLDWAAWVLTGDPR